MKTQDIIPLDYKRMPESLGGHVIYFPNEISICRYHKYCAYTGDEPDRCSRCHSSNDIGCAHTEDGHGGLPPNRRSPALCRSCNELFSSNTSYDRHLRPLDDNRICYNPERRGLVMVEQNGWYLWANPGSRPEQD